MRNCSFLQNIAQIQRKLGKQSFFLFEVILYHLLFIHQQKRKVDISKSLSMVLILKPSLIYICF